MFKIILGFLPWILYFIIAGKTRDENQAAIIVALATTVLFDYKELKKGFVLTLGTVIFFLSLFIVTFFTTLTWPEDHAGLISNSALAFIAWISLLINKPFTLQYAREQVSSEYWELPGFLFVNQVITFVWACALLIMAIMSFYESSFNKIVYQIISYGPSIFAIWFTSFFPDWYKGFQFRQLSKDKEDLSKNVFLQGNFAPIKTEIDVQNLKIEGTLPNSIDGVYMRNGPNPLFDPISYTYPIDGDGMLHAVTIHNKKAHYRNRFVETKGLIAEKKAGKALYGGIRKPIPTDPKLVGKNGDPGPVKDGAFIHIIQHAKQYIALHETNEAYEVTADLKTIGPWCPQGTKAPFHVNAHTRLDPKTKELFAFTYDTHPPYLRYYVFNETGAITKEVPIEKNHASMMHDFVLTENYLVFFDCPAIFDFNNLKKNKPLLEWKKEYPVNIIVVNRHDQSTFTIQTDSFFVYHFVNGFEKNNQIIIDYVRYDSFTIGSHLESNLSYWYRAIIDINTKTVKLIQCDDRNVEFPRINDAYQTRQNQFIYLPSQNRSTEDTGLYNLLIRYDTEKQTSVVHDFGDAIEIGEPIFIPENNAENEDEGFVGVFAYDKSTQKSEFVLLHAQAIEDKPIARIQMPQRVPHGLHGSWIPNI